MTTMRTKMGIIMIQNNVIVNIEQVIKDFVINCEEMKEILDYRCL
jgi:hypothetical protein